MKRRTLRDHCRCGGVLVPGDGATPKGWHYICLSCDRDLYFKDAAFLSGRTSRGNAWGSAPTGGNAA